MCKIDGAIGRAITDLAEEVPSFRRPDSEYKIPESTFVFCTVRGILGDEYYVCPTTEEIQEVMDKAWNVTAWYVASIPDTKIMPNETKLSGALKALYISLRLRRFSEEGWIVKNVSGVILSCEGNIPVFSRKETAEDYIDTKNEDGIFDGVTFTPIKMRDLGEFSEKHKQKIILDPDPEGKQVPRFI